MLDSAAQTSTADLSFIHRQEKNSMWASTASSAYINYLECSLPVEKLKVSHTALVGAEDMRIF